MAKVHSQAFQTIFFKTLPKEKNRKLYMRSCIPSEANKRIYTDSVNDSDLDPVWLLTVHPYIKRKIFIGVILQRNHKWNM